MSKFSPYITWTIFSLPAFVMIYFAFASANPEIFETLVHPSGTFSARFLIVAMMATPLAMLLKGWRGPIWLKKNRRYLGVAAFGYGVLHTLFYMSDKGTLAQVVTEVPLFYIWTGWVALIIFVPLAMTSMDYFVRKMGTWWKWL